MRHSEDVYRQERERWNHNALYYTRETGSPYFRALLEKKLRCYGIETFRDAVAVDIGSGNGHFFSHIRQFCDFFSVNLDFAFTMLRSGAAFRLPRQCYFVNGAAERLPFRDASVDVAVFNGALHHLKALGQLEPAASETARILRPGGRVCVFDRNGSLSSRLFHSAALKGKQLLESLAGVFSSSSSDIEPDFNDADLRVFLDNGFVMERRVAVSSVPFFLLLVACNAVEYTAGVGAAGLARRLTFPVATFCEDFLCFRAFSIEQCLVMRRSGSTRKSKG